MNINTMLAELREEVQTINEAIAALERIARSRPKGRGRPPRWLLGETSGDDAQQKTRSLEARMRMAEAQRRRRAAERAAARAASR